MFKRVKEIAIILPSRKQTAHVGVINDRVFDQGFDVGEEFHSFLDHADQSKLKML